MSLADDIAAVLPELRAQAESLMVDSCRITGPGEGDPVWDPDSGTYTDPAPVVVFEGRCQLPKVEPSGQSVDSGETNWAVGIVQIKLPMSAAPGEAGDPLAVADGHSVEVTSRPGLLMSVRFVVPQTWEKSRKVSCEVVSRDG